jgi:hypothetical protein
LQQLVGLGAVVDHFDQHGVALQDAGQPIGQDGIIFH